MKSPEGWSEKYRAVSRPWLACGNDTQTGDRESMMILASAMRHSVGRPATGMEGGTLDLWSGTACRHPRRY